MIIDLYSSFQELNSDAGKKAQALMIKRQTSPRQPEINLVYYPIVMQMFFEIQDELKSAQKNKHDYNYNNDHNQEQKIKDRIAKHFSTTKSIASRFENIFNLAQQSLEEERTTFNDPNNLDACLRIPTNLLTVLYAKFMLLMNEFNQLQLDVQRDYKEKIKRQIRVLDRDLLEKDVGELVTNPDKLQKFFTEKRYGATVGVQNAISDIDEKLAEIKELKRNMKKLVILIKNLSKIVREQNVVFDSIDATVGKVENHVTAANKELESGKEYMNSAKSVLLIRKHGCFFCFLLLLSLLCSIKSWEAS